MWLAPNLARMKRALVVDDHHELRALLGEIIASYGYSVSQAENGEKALQLFEQTGGTFELLLTDLHMPEMSGRDLILEVRKRNPALPIIAVTGLATQDTYREIEALGVTLFRKPINFVALNAYIQNLV